jgi:hypothetical protein
MFGIKISFKKDKNSLSIIEQRFDTTPRSIINDLLYDLTTISKGELLPFERLFILNQFGGKYPVNERSLVDLYMESGCFSEAKEVYEKLKHWRKLGDLSWCLGDVEGAKDYYSRPENSSKDAVCRKGPDWDRLIKLAFFRSEWSEVARLLLDAKIMVLPKEKQIVLGSSATALKPYLDMAIIAFVMLKGSNDKNTPKQIGKAFDIPEDEFLKIISVKQNIDTKEIDILKKQVVPKVVSRQRLTLADALAKGNTVRARSVFEFLSKADELLEKARNLIKSFINKGADSDLKEFIEIVTKSGVDSIAQTFLFAAMGNDGYDPKSAPLDRLVRFYGAHPIMNKRYFGRFLDAKFRGNFPVQGENLLVGILQRMYSVTEVIDKESFSDKLDFNRLISCRDWAEMRLDDWAKLDGRDQIERVRKIWLKGEAVKVKSPFNTTKQYPESPRDMQEWFDLLKNCHAWLSERWEQEIGISPWVTENRLFELVKKAFKEYEVIRHAQPLWLAPQHLDIFIPELSLAIEFMGEQHYKPISYFGGEEGYAKTVERDKKKTEICQLAKINLIYIRFNDDIAKRVNDIKEQTAH